VRKHTLTSILLIFTSLGMLLAGCSPAAASAGTSNDAGTGGGNQGSMPLSTRLALGTLQLEKTGPAVTPEQAAELLPLWKAANSLSTADNVTADELNAIFGQIQEAMTAQQMEAIQAMDLSGENMANLMQELGIEMPQGPSGTPDPQLRATMEATRASGQRPEGFTPPEGGFAGGPGGEGGFQGDQGFAPPSGGQASSSNENQRLARQGRGGLNGALYQAVIQLLEAKM